MYSIFRRVPPSTRAYHWAASILPRYFGAEPMYAVRRGSVDSLNQTGQQVVRRNLNIQPTLTIRPGFPVRVIVNRDLLLAPYQA
jgi:type IV secretory pathway VirB10-like protein